MRKIRICVLLCGVLCMSPGRAVESYNNAVKVTFLSWMTGSTKLSYERAFANHQSGEICASMIGAGYDKFHNKPLGFTVRYGHKFFLNDNPVGGLRGFYVRPEAIYSHYSYDSALMQVRTPARMVALLATTGYQMTYGRLLVDAWVVVMRSVYLLRRAIITALRYGMCSARGASTSLSVSAFV